jgi:hypothetical protein
MQIEDPGMTIRERRHSKTQQASDASTSRGLPLRQEKRAVLTASHPTQEGPFGGPLGLLIKRVNA